MKIMALPALVSGLFGVTEPRIYGITLPKKNRSISPVSRGSSGGGILGGAKVLRYQPGALGFFGFINIWSPRRFV